MTHVRLEAWGLLLLGAMAIVACGRSGDGGGGSGGGGGGPGPIPGTVHPLDKRGQDCGTCHPTMNLAMLHRVDHPTYDSDCLKCHGDMLDEKTLSATVAGPHTVMIPAFLAPGVTKPTNGLCAQCHYSTDFERITAADLNRQVNTVWCWSCHKASGPNLPALYPD